MADYGPTNRSVKFSTENKVTLLSDEDSESDIPERAFNKFQILNDSEELEETGNQVSSDGDPDDEPSTDGKSLSFVATTPRILSIQSHVVSGYCGNKSATFPLQLLELEVDVINSVQLSNHTQYKFIEGQISKGEDLEALHLGLKANNLLPLYDHVLSGYVAGTGYIEAMAKLILEIKDAREAIDMPCWYTLDPVLGDDGTGFYVPDGANVAKAYMHRLVPLADIITPNRFEASILTGQEIDSSSEEAMKQAILAIDKFHRMGIRIVALTSFEIADQPEQLICLLSYDASYRRKKSPMLGTDRKVLLKISLPKLSCPFTGTGDLFTALLTGWLRRTNFDFKKSFEYTANSIHHILLDTLELYKQINDGSVHSFELRLVQNQKSLIEPKVIYEAEEVNM